MAYSERELAYVRQESAKKAYSSGRQRYIVACAAMGAKLGDCRFIGHRNDSLPELFMAKGFSSDFGPDGVAKVGSNGNANRVSRRSGSSFRRRPSVKGMGANLRTVSF